MQRERVNERANERLNERTRMSAMLFCFANAYENELSLVISCDKSADANRTNKPSFSLARPCTPHRHRPVHCTQRKRENERKREQVRRRTQKRSLYSATRNADALWLLCVSHTFSRRINVWLTMSVYMSVSVFERCVLFFFSTHCIRTMAHGITLCFSSPYKNTIQM